MREHHRFPVTSAHVTHLSKLKAKGEGASMGTVAFVLCVNFRGSIYHDVS